MKTFLFDKIIFGPVKSRRLGVSLGINLIPENAKICTFNCIYCECGWTNNAQLKSLQWPSLQEFSNALEEKLIDMQKSDMLPDVITFAGNGEPTLHPHFTEIIDETIKLRKLFSPKSKIAVLTNGTKIGIPKIFDALNLIDDCIIKLDSGLEETISTINQPYGKIDIHKYVEKIKKFNGNCIIQSLFLKGKYRNQIINNTTDKEIDSWLKLIKEIRPREVQVYTFERATALSGLQKVSCKKLKQIAERVRSLGISAQVSS